MHMVRDGTVRVMMRSNQLSEKRANLREAGLKFNGT